MKTYEEGYKKGIADENALWLRKSSPFNLKGENHPAYKHLPKNNLYSLIEKYVKYNKQTVTIPLFMWIPFRGILKKLKITTN